MKKLLTFVAILVVIVVATFNSFAEVVTLDENENWCSIKKLWCVQRHGRAFINCVDYCDLRHRHEETCYEICEQNYVQSVKNECWFMDACNENQ